MDTAKLRHIFSTRIRKLREGKLNQGEFADTVGVSRGAMSYYEQELRTPDISVLRSICVKYNVSADYLLGIMADPNHAVADVCRETGLSPEAVRTLNLIERLAETDFNSHRHMRKEFDEDFHDAIQLAPFTSVTELLNILLENELGLSLLTLLGAIILGAEIDRGDESVTIKMKSSSKNFTVSVPVENLTAALWVNIQEAASDLREIRQNVL